MSRLRIESAHLLPHPVNVRVADAPWRLYQRWEDILFLHWPVDPDHVRRLVPDPLKVHTCDGSAWISLSALRISHMRVRHLPPLPGASSFAEVNVRTYVRGDDGRPAVYFLSLDAGSRLTVEAARFVYALPYFRSAVTHSWTGACLSTRAERRDRRGVAASFSAECCLPQGIHGTPQPADDPLSAWLLERYQLITAHKWQLMSVDVAHRQWAARRAHVLVSENTLGHAFGCDLERQPALAHYAGVMDASIGSPVILPSATPGASR
jgi:uncharacterized protein YqjF (DUF2071 family)